MEDCPSIPRAASTPSTAFLNADGVQAVLSFLNSDNDTKTIAFPRTVSLDGEKTELMVVNNVPIFARRKARPRRGLPKGWRQSRRITI